MTALQTPPAPSLAPATPGAPDSDLSAAERYLHATRDRALLDLLRRRGVASLAGRRIVELGCAGGALLSRLLSYGAGAALLEAVDIDPMRVRRARAAAPGARVAVASAAALPYADGAFDLAFAFTFFSSVLDGETRRLASEEALRVLRPGGLLVVYDFWTNPINRRVRALRERELRALFGRAVTEVVRVTLAPPVVRALGGHAALCAPLERMPFLRTHLLAAVVKE